jgi:cell division protein FtsQ
LREVGPGPVSWWRADDPPAPRPVLKAPAPATRWRRRLGTLVLGAAAGLLIANPELRASALAHIERAVEIAGLGLHEVRLVGHRFTVDTDIYAALDLDNARTLLSFNAGAAQARLEQLPWIERASVERVGIDRIDVRVRERVPFALWRSGDRSWLIDRTGRRLQLVPADIMPGLMRVAGDGAPKETAALSGLLADFPQIARRLEFAERVGNRRWTLHLAGGTSVALPSVNEADALVRLGRLMASGLGGASHIDLRVAGRTLVRGLDGGGAAAPAAAAAARRT